MLTVLLQPASASNMRLSFSNVSSWYHLYVAYMTPSLVTNPSQYSHSTELPAPAGHKLTNNTRQDQYCDTSSSVCHNSFSLMSLSLAEAQTCLSLLSVSSTDVLMLFHILLLTVVNWAHSLIQDFLLR